MSDERTTARNERLDELKKAVDDWADREIKRLSDEATFLKSILKGRTGAGRLANQNVADSKRLLVDEIKTFLEG
jgi:hypothetical protein